MTLDLSQISFGKKIGILSAVFIIALLAVGIGGVWGIRHASQFYELSQRQLFIGQNILRADKAREGLQTLVSRALAITESQTGAGTEKALQDVSALSQDLHTALGAIVPEYVPPSGHKTFQHVRTAATHYTDQAEKIAGLVSSGQQLPSDVEILAFEEVFAALGKHLAVIERLVEEETHAATQRSKQARIQVERILTWEMLLGVCLGCSLGWFFFTTMSTPFAHLTSVASRLATGDLQQQVDYTSADEMGALATALRELLHYLRGLAQAAERIGNNDLSVQIRPRSGHDVLSRHFMHLLEMLRNRQTTLQAGSDSLTDALKLMARSLTQLSTSSTETTSSITETAATVEQVRQTAQLSALKAKEVAAHSQQAVVISQSGEQSVEEARTGILEMRAHVESIAKSVATLDEQSQAIGDIIMTVKDLAEQSHVLAVNAAIEAAKAGESGRGFGVVAQEVKTLAEQSQKATTQIYAILHDVQQAVSAAMEATQQGTNSVEVGVKKSIGAGELLQILSQNVAETGQAVIQIATNSEQQLIGVDQMVLAVEHIKSAASLHLDGLEHIGQAVQNVQTVGRTFHDMLTQLTKQLMPDDTNPDSNGVGSAGMHGDAHTWNPSTRPTSV